MTQYMGSLGSNSGYCKFCDRNWAQHFGVSCVDGYTRSLCGDCYKIERKQMRHARVVEARYLREDGGISINGPGRIEFVRGKLFWARGFRPVQVTQITWRECLQMIKRRMPIG